MRSLRHLKVGAVLGLIGLGLTACQSQKDAAPVVTGYVQVVHRSHGLLHSGGSRIAFDYRKPSGQTLLIWPDLADDNVAYNGSVAVFMGQKAYLPDKIIRPRLFAVDAPELPMDITDEVLRRWAAANGKSFAGTLHYLSSITLEATTDRLIVHLEFWLSDLNLESKNWPDQSSLTLDWPQVTALMQTLKTQGVPKQDPQWQTPYIGEKNSRL